MIKSILVGSGGTPYTSVAIPKMKQEEIRHCSPKYQDYDDHHKHRHGYKRKKSFLEELFD